MMMVVVVVVVVVVVATVVVVSQHQWCPCSGGPSAGGGGVVVVVVVFLRRNFWRCWLQGGRTAFTPLLRGDLPRLHIYTLYMQPGGSVPVIRDYPGFEAGWGRRGVKVAPVWPKAAGPVRPGVLCPL